jgi:hypothetical protein
MSRTRRSRWRIRRALARDELPSTELMTLAPVLYRRQITSSCHFVPRHACTRGPGARRVRSREHAAATVEDARPEQPDRARRLRRRWRWRWRWRQGRRCRRGSGSWGGCGSRGRRGGRHGRRGLRRGRRRRSAVPTATARDRRLRGSDPAGRFRRRIGRCVGHGCDGSSVHNRFPRRLARVNAHLGALSCASDSAATGTARDVTRDESVNDYDEQYQRRERAQRGEFPPGARPDASRPSAHGRPDS